MLPADMMHVTGAGASIDDDDDDDDADVTGRDGCFVVEPFSASPSSFHLILGVKIGYPV